MKTISFFILGLSLILYSNRGFSDGITNNQRGVQPNNSSKISLSLMVSPELQSLATNWATEYGRLNQGTDINIINTAGNQSNTGNTICIITGENSEKVTDETKWKMVIGRDAIIPVINPKNPMLKEIMQQGISSGEFAQLFTNPVKQSWDVLVAGGQKTAVHLYMTENESLINSISNFTKISNAGTIGIKVANGTDLISAVQRDVYAIGFCKLTDALDATTHNLATTITMLPIDKNGNGRIDNFENIYENLDAFTRGIWIGKYPAALCGSIYATSASRPTDQVAIAFLSWMMGDGQQFLNPNGYSTLASSERQSNIDALSNIELPVSQSNKPFTSNTWLILLFIIIITGLIATSVVRVIRNKRSTGLNEAINISPALDENTIIAPRGIYFDKTHTWAFMEKDGNVKIGIDDFLQHITGKLNRIIMKVPGEKVRKGEKIMTIIRDGKQLTIYAPISGIIKEQNLELVTDSSKMNSSPYSEGWVYLIEPKNWEREIQFMFMGEKYKEWLKEEFTRLKEFFTASVKSNSSVYAHIILQDGGELTDNILAELGPEVWEDFQNKFIDTSR